MKRIILGDAQREELQAISRKHNGSAAQIRRARCVLLCADGERRVDIRNKLACNDAFVTHRVRAYRQQGANGLVSRYPGRAPTRSIARVEAKVLNRTLNYTPKDGSTRWSSRKLRWRAWRYFVHDRAAYLAQTRRAPAPAERHMVSSNPDFEAKAADVIGLYLKLPAHAAVFCVDEKTAVQALDRKDRMLPLSPGRAESHGFEHERNGTLSLFAAFSTATGEVLGTTADHHTSEQFVEFLQSIVASQDVKYVQMHYTPTYSSWLNQVENWFARIQRDVIARGIFTSTKDIDKKLMRYIRQHNKKPKPMTWKYADPRRRIASDFKVSVD